jgi:ADP-ribose pyrophosphatase YjhB (NUDIX family)
MRQVGGRLREICPVCGWIHYRQLKVGAGALIVRNDSLLLLRRQQEPFLGLWNLPAGYVEYDESPSCAAEREVLEETALRIKTTNLAGVYFFNDDPRGNGVFLVYECVLSGGEPVCNKESSQWKFFPTREIPDLLAGGGHDQAIDAWRSQNACCVS